MAWSWGPGTPFGLKESLPLRTIKTMDGSRESVTCRILALLPYQPRPVSRSPPLGGRCSKPGGLGGRRRRVTQVQSFQTRRQRIPSRGPRFPNPINMLREERGCGPDNLAERGWTLPSRETFWSGRGWRASHAAWGGAPSVSLGCYNRPHTLRHSGHRERLGQVRRRRVARERTPPPRR